MDIATCTQFRRSPFGVYDENPYFPALQQLVWRIHWRLLRRERRWQERTRHVDLNVFPASSNAYEEAEWRVMLAMLPPEEERVITLVVMEEYTEREAAELLGCSQHHVHNLKAQGLAELAEILRG